eukprot:CAMPEP_0118646214 /NCGR_PEP_ID=MMETSP0785-20121206/7932_1 /TAXON_ID=91992 /ORGANISM="Bolidomonas pacifica, Strain CCMP 1866" /LENGTH=104 /DNA_ID=CAMNT_0006538183 /DNA_START=40 /DNA_END=354 /DNA_ORIENTATION=+
MYTSSLFVVLAIVCLSQTLAFTPAKPTAFRMNSVRLMAKDDYKTEANNNVKAVLAGVSTALAPMAAHADTVDEAQVIGLGVGLVACIVSLAVGFTIGYGTLNKL